VDADMLSLAIGDRSVNTAESFRIAVGVYEALQRMERKRLVTSTGEGCKAARWRLGRALDSKSAARD
jgi:hypothetical protein